MDNTLTSKIASTFLGKRVEGSAEYDPSLLVPVPRSENREKYNIDNKNLPFEGFDVWHGYEFSSMTENGLPFTRVIKLRYNCANSYIVESKSLKLYLNSFNMSRFGKTINEGLKLCKDIIEKDLSKALETPVEVEFLDHTCAKVDMFEDYQDLVETIDQKTILIDKFNEAPEVLEVLNTIGSHKSHKYFFDSERSRCRITKQPDFGHVFIYYKDDKRTILPESLIKYIVSFRNENHFHEECCEMMFSRIRALLSEDAELMITAMYTRRGGIDINPVRFTTNCNPQVIKEVYKLYDLKTLAKSNINQ